RYRPAIAVGGTVLAAIGGAFLYDVHDKCSSAPLEDVLDGCLAPVIVEGTVGTLIASAGLVLLAATVLSSARDEPTPVSQRPIDDRYAAQARLAAGSGNCIAVRALLERIDPSRRPELEADPAIAACL